MIGPDWKLLSNRAAAGRARAGFLPALVISLLLLAGAAPAQATESLLPQEKLHAAYLEGEFDVVEEALDQFIGTHKTYSRADSLFVARYLGVIYAASPETREKGRYYMLRLLDLDPNSGLVDLFVSEKIDEIFEKVKKDHSARQRAQGKPSTALATADSKPVDPGKSRPGVPVRAQAEKSKAKSHTALFWTVGGLGLIAAGAATYYYMGNEKPQDKVYDIPRPN